ncbi:unnamed protein product [Closterium sp. Yama58-4]|nr:unnamed protein product [Closterium sp. Yama58-4]
MTVRFSDFAAKFQLDSQGSSSSPFRYNAMARALLSVGIMIFLAAILALSFAQATSAEAAGVVTAENAASSVQPNEVPREQSHRKLVMFFDDGISTPCRSDLFRKTQACNAQSNPDAVKKCLESLAPLRRDCLAGVASANPTNDGQTMTTNGGRRGKTTKADLYN